MSRTGKQKAAALFVGALAAWLCLVLSSCTGLAGGYRAVQIVKQAGDETGKTLAAACKVKREACTKKHPAKSAELKTCLRPCLTALRAWVKVVRPTINSANLAAWGALETAYAAKKHSAAWLSKLKPGPCALIKALKQWKHLAEGKFTAILKTVGSLEGLVCS